MRIARRRLMSFVGRVIPVRRDAIGDVQHFALAKRRPDVRQNGSEDERNDNRDQRASLRKCPQQGCRGSPHEVHSVTRAIVKARYA